MAVKGTTKGDLLQILIFTFLLCTLFFGAWGGWVWWKNKDRTGFRKKISDEIATMEKLYKEDENKQGLINYRRQKELRKGEDGSQLSEVINKVIDRMQPATRVKYQSGRSSKKTQSDNTTELILSFGLEDCPLKSLVEFCDLLERDRPDVKVTSLKIQRKVKANQTDLDDVWNTSNFSVSTYVSQGESSGGEATEKPEAETDG